MAGGYEMPSFAGERVALRPMELQEAALVQQWQLESDPLNMTCRPPIIMSITEAIEMIQKREPNPLHATFAVILRGTGTLVGQVRYFDLNFRNRSAEIGYIIAPSARGKAFGREAISLLLGYLFDGLGMNKAYAQTASFNAPSVRLLETLGFRRDGVLREHHLYQGVLHDSYLYSILVREWRELRKP